MSFDDIGKRSYFLFLKVILYSLTYNRICLALGNNSALTVHDCPIVRFVCVTVSPMSPAHNPHIRSTKKFYKFIHFTETLKNEIVYIILYCVQQKETEI